MFFTVMTCPHTNWQEVSYVNGVITAICLNKKCQEKGEFTVEEWNALGDQSS